MERNPKVELAHATPRFLYIAVAKRGNPAPKPDRIKSARRILGPVRWTQRCMAMWTNRYQQGPKPHILGKRPLGELMSAKGSGSILLQRYKFT